ncbi:MAG TPA: metallophosphoesterase [Thermomicrobiales bacterium]|nr:metallophosphoesterase [Thermomicrobiales bacterium]
MPDAPTNPATGEPGGTSLRILAVSDEVDQRIYSTTLRDRMSDVQLVIGCGDLPATYLEFLVDSLNVPVYYVLGNHAEELTRMGERGIPRLPEGCINVGGTVVRDPGTGLLIAGLPGSPRYAENEPVQYTEFQMRWMMLKLAPRLYWNRFRHGRALDLLVTHAPPRDLNDRDDIAHRGFVAMRKFLKRFMPTYQLHGHIHLYDRTISNRVRFDKTEIVNVYPYQRLDLAFPHLSLGDSPSSHNAEHRP